MELLKYIKGKINFIKTLIILGSVIAFLFTTYHIALGNKDSLRLWEIQSIDTMKTSRDKARAELYNPQFDGQIERELSAIKSMGANYVAINTPYDDEFLPFLKRWVNLARKYNLKVWFRGNFSNWEGWFGYEKNLTPQEHLKKTAEFIEKHPDLFAAGDIFDPCPECENAGFWKQPENNAQYNEFIKKEHQVATQSFKKINKNVHANLFSIIGGRAKEVLTQDTANKLGNIITIDHYVKNPANMEEYIDYFSKNLHSKTLFGEFGAPIPDLHGDMTEIEQAEFVEHLFHQMYRNKDKVYGANYSVLSEGTSALLNDDGSPRKAVEVVKKYFIPGVIKGTVTNTVGEKLEKIQVKTRDGLNTTTTDANGEYKLIIPQSTVDILIEGKDYNPKTQKVTVTSGNEVARDIVLEPQKIGLAYRIKMLIQDFKNKLLLLFHLR